MKSVKIGRLWEEKIENGFGRLDYCTVKKVPAPVRVIGFPAGRKRNTGAFVGYFEARGACDFEGIYHGVPVCMEAKSTSAARWPFASSIKGHQWSRMLESSNMLALAGVLLEWAAPEGPPAYYGISMQQLVLWHDAGKRSVTPHDVYEAMGDGGRGIAELSLGIVISGTFVNVQPFLTLLMERRPR